MSNKTTLQSHNTRLQNLINTANSLPDAGSGGGSGAKLKTCQFSIEGGVWYKLYYTTVENGQIVHKLEDCTGNLKLITVLCDSLIYYDAYETNTFTIDNENFSILPTNGIPKAVLIKASSIENDYGWLGESFDDEDWI